MSDATRELVTAILAGKDYNEVFRTAMAEKASKILDAQREIVAARIFDKPNDNN